MRGRNAAGLAVLLLGAAGLVWVLRGEPAVQDPANADRSASGDATRSVASPDEEPPVVAEPATRQPLTADAWRTLRVVVVDRDGRPAPGKLAVRTSRFLPAFSSGADPLLAPLDPEIAMHEHAGALDLPHPAAHWLTLRASGVAGTAFHLLEPERDCTELRLVLDPVERHVDVLVVESDFVTAVRGGTVHVLGEGLIPIDAFGRARIDAGERTELVLVAPGADRDDGSPFAERVFVVPAPLPFHRLVTLVRPGPRAELQLAIEVQDGQGGDVLALRRVDDGSYAETPGQTALRSGAQSLRMRLDEGEYQLVTWPLGRLVADGGPATIRVRGPRCDARVRLVACSERVTLHLLGIESWKLPIHVLPQPADGVLAVGDCGAFLGPWTWRTLTGEVVPPNAPIRLVAHGPEGTWISTPPWDGRSSEVRMTAASRVDFHWRPDRGGITRAWLEVHSAFGDEIVPLHFGIRRTGSGPIAGFLGSCFVPSGTIGVTCAFEGASGSGSLAPQTMDVRATRCALGIGTAP